MIQINKKLAAEAASIHLESCKPYVESRLKFLVELFKAISRSQFVTFKKTKKAEKERELRTIYGLRSIKSFRTTLAPISKKEIGYDDIFLMLEKGEFGTLLILNFRECKAAYLFFNNVLAQIELILSEDPNSFKEYLTTKSKNKQRQFKDLIEIIFSYEKLGKKNGEAFGTNKDWNSYALTKKLEVNVCPYCNKNWVSTVIDEDGNKITNPQLDHYFSKSVYPLLRLSIYNLIPSCETCNARIKKRKELKIKKHIHPYIDGFDPEYYFAPAPKNSNSAFGLDDKYTISLKEDDSSVKCGKAKESFKFFHIKDVYEQHGDIISEIYFKKSKYNLTALEDLLGQEMFKGMSLDDAYRIVFANYLNLEEYNKRPFAKLTKDTLRYLEVIIESDEL